MRTEKVVLFWVVLYLGLLPCFSQSNPGRQQQIEVHTRKAAEYLKENKPDLAVPEFRAILALDPQLQQAIAREREQAKHTGPELEKLEKDKQADNSKSKEMLTQLHDLESQVNSDLKAGLITKGDATSQLAALNQAETAYTDSRIAAVELSNNVLAATTVGTKSLDAIEKQAELRSDLAQLEVTLSVAGKQLMEDNRQVQRLHERLLCPGNVGRNSIAKQALALDA